MFRKLRLLVLVKLVVSLFYMFLPNMIIGILRPIIEIELFITFLKLTGKLPIKNYLFTIVISSILSSMP